MTTSNAPTRVAIRSATAADRRFLVRLADRLADFEPPPGRTRADIAEADRQALLEGLDRPRAGSALFVAEYDGTPAGCLLLWTLEDYFTRTTHAHISVVAVTKAAEGRGVGRALMAHAEAWARAQGHDRITLSVFENNGRARALYDRVGYATEMRRMIRHL